MLNHYSNAAHSFQIHGLLTSCLVSPVLLFRLVAIGIAFLCLVQSKLIARFRSCKGIEKEAVAKVQSAIEMIAKGKADERLAIVSKLLEDRQMVAELVPFEEKSKKGTNLKTELSGAELQAAPWLVLGAHLDRVALGQGIIDNGCGCIALMELAARLKKDPLPKHRVTALYFDLEEQGLLRSAASSKSLSEKPKAFINLDVFAYGRQVWLHSLEEKDSFVSAAKKVDEQSSLSLDHGVAYPPSDHLSFRAAGIYSVSFSLLPPDEVAEVEAMFGGNRSIRPKILSTIHTPDDTPLKAVPNDILDGVDFLEKTIRLWVSDGAGVPPSK